MTLRLRSGQILVELMLALAVVAMVMIGLVQVSTRSISNADFSKNQSAATSYTSAAIECAMAQRSALGWQAFFAAPTIGTCGTVPSTFTRDVTFIPSGSEIKVDVTVSWEASGKTFSSKQSTVFTQY